MLLPVLLGSALFGVIDGGCIPPPTTFPSQYVKFYLTTRSARLVPVEDTEDGVKSAPFLDLPLKVLIHGTNGSRFDTPNLELIPSYLKIGDYNILTVDYGSLVTTLCFLVRTGVVGPVGAGLARVLKLIVKAFPGLTIEETHILGFSLGAHVAAVTASRLLPLKIGRITGLDVGGIGYERFQKGNVMGEDLLDPEDALFVDVVHSDGLVLGSIQPLGHLDFYINRGYAQPGCPFYTSSFFMPGPLSWAICSHTRSAKVFAESLTSTTGIYGQECSFGKANLRGELCPAISSSLSFARMGSTQHRGTFKVTTGATHPWSNNTTVV